VKKAATSKGKITMASVSVVST